MFSPCLSIKGYSYLFGKGIRGVCAFILEWDLKQSVWRNTRLLLWHPSLFLFTCLCLSICLSFSFSLCSPSLTPSTACHFFSLSSSILLLFLVSLLAPSCSHSHPFYLALIALSNFSASVSPRTLFVHYHGVEACDCSREKSRMAGRRKDYGLWLNLMDRFMSLACPLNHRGHQRLPLTSRTRCVLNGPVDEA